MPHPRKNGLAVNGMSYSGRDGKNANSAIIVSVTPDDFDGEDALAGVRFQEQLEEKAYALGNGKIPQQLLAIICKDQASTHYGTFQSTTKGASVLCNLRGLLPAELEASFIEGMHSFGTHLPGFDRADAILSGVESRTSSPVRIPRNEFLEAAVSGIYPVWRGCRLCGRYHIRSDGTGLKVAEQIIEK